MPHTVPHYHHNRVPGEKVKEALDSILDGATMHSGEASSKKPLPSKRQPPIASTTPWVLPEPKESFDPFAPFESFRTTGKDHQPVHPDDIIHATPLRRSERVSSKRGAEDALMEIDTDGPTQVPAEKRGRFEHIIPQPRLPVAGSSSNQMSDAKKLQKAAGVVALMFGKNRLDGEHKTVAQSRWAKIKNAVEIKQYELKPSQIANCTLFVNKKQVGEVYAVNISRHNKFWPRSKDKPQTPSWTFDYTEWEKATSIFVNISFRHHTMNVHLKGGPHLRGGHAARLPTILKSQESNRLVFPVAVEKIEFHFLWERYKHHCIIFAPRAEPHVG